MQFNQLGLIAVGRGSALKDMVLLSLEGLMLSSLELTFWIDSPKLLPCQEKSGRKASIICFSECSSDCGVRKTSTLADF